MHFKTYSIKIILKNNKQEISSLQYEENNIILPIKEILLLPIFIARL